MIPSVRTNPLADLGGDLEYSNGYGRAVSDYTAALQQKYGSVGIPDLSSRKSSSQLYFSSSSGGERSRSQSQTLQQIRASLEVTNFTIVFLCILVAWVLAIDTYIMIHRKNQFIRMK